ncbi:hypothetical protein, partial [Aeromonas sp. R6-2]|uniref:hypothetical protein n=1 Tax=Aeromonas sp. R6-2 TaxID=3138472 RepID=UPI0034A40222
PASAHTDCLIQFVKEQRDLHRDGSGILRFPPGESSLILQGFFTHRPARCCGGVALSMEAHYREFARRGNRDFEKNHIF